MIRIAGIDARKIIAAYREIECDETKTPRKRREARQAADFAELEMVKLANAWSADYARRLHAARKAVRL